MFSLTLGFWRRMVKLLFGERNFATTAIIQPGADFLPLLCPTRHIGTLYSYWGFFVCLFVFQKRYFIFSNKQTLIYIKCLLVKKDPSVAVRFKVLIARLSALSLQVVHVLWHPSWLIWCKPWIQAEICHRNAQFTKRRQCHWLCGFFAVILRCLKLFAEAIEWYPLVQRGDCLVRNCLTFIIWIFAFIFSSWSVHTEAIVYSPKARSQQLHLSQKDPSAFDYHHLNCSEKAFWKYIP